MKPINVLGRMLTMTLSGACLLGFLLFGNLSIYYGAGVQEAMNVGLALQFKLPRLAEKPKGASWPAYLLSGLQQSLLFTFAEPAAGTRTPLAERKLTLAGVWSRLQSMVRIEERYQNEISSHTVGLPGAKSEKNI